MNKTKVIHIGGGEVFDSKESYYNYLRSLSYDPYLERHFWGKTLADELGEEYEYIKLRMPNADNADYIAWEIMFEKLFPYLTEGKLVLIGHSLGGIFLLHYLSTKTFLRKIDQLHIIAGVLYDDGLSEEVLGNFAFPVEEMKHISPQAEEIHVYHSEDDEVVPFGQGKEIHERLPGSHFHTFTDRGHFIGETFPELIAAIKG